MSAVLVHESGIVENVGVAVGIEQQANSVQYVFTFPVSVLGLTLHCMAAYKITTLLGLL